MGGELKTVGSDTRPRRRGSPARRRGPGRAPPSGRKRAGPGGHAGTCQGKRGKAISEVRPARARAHVQARTRCAGRPVTSVLTEHGPRRRVRRRAAGRTSGVDVHAGADGGRVPDSRRGRPLRDVGVCPQGDRLPHESLSGKSISQSVGNRGPSAGKALREFTPATGRRRRPGPGRDRGGQRAGWGLFRPDLPLPAQPEGSWMTFNG